MLANQEKVGQQKDVGVRVRYGALREIRGRNEGKLGFRGEAKLAAEWERGRLDLQLAALRSEGKSARRLARLPRTICTHSRLHGEDVERPLGVQAPFEVLDPQGLVEIRERRERLNR